MCLLLEEGNKVSAADRSPIFEPVHLCRDTRYKEASVADLFWFVLRQWPRNRHRVVRAVVRKPRAETSRGQYEDTKEYEEMWKAYTGSAPIVMTLPWLL